MTEIKKLRIKTPRVHIARNGRTFCGRVESNGTKCQSEDLPVPGNVCSVCLNNLQAIRIVRMA